MKKSKMVCQPKIKNGRGFTLPRSVVTRQGGFTSPWSVAKRQRGFTLIELLVVISIIVIIAALVTVSVSQARKQSRNAKRISDLGSIQLALEMYRDKKGYYPKTYEGEFTSGGSSAKINYDPGCGPIPNIETDANTISPDPSKPYQWIPELVQEGLMSKVPIDPLPKNQRYLEDTTKTGHNGQAHCYIYQSNGAKYLLSAWNVVEGGPMGSDSDYYTRAGFRQSSVLNWSQYYICDNPSIGAKDSVYNPKYDYYKHSYTATSSNFCTNWTEPQ